MYFFFQQMNQQILQQQTEQLQLQLQQQQQQLLQSQALTAQMLNNPSDLQNVLQQNGLSMINGLNELQIRQQRAADELAIKQQQQQLILQNQTLHRQILQNNSQDNIQRLLNQNQIFQLKQANIDAKMLQQQLQQIQPNQNAQINNGTQSWQPNNKTLNQIQNIVINSFERVESPLQQNSQDPEWSEEISRKRQKLCKPMHKQKLRDVKNNNNFDQGASGDEFSEKGKTKS